MAPLALVFLLFLVVPIATIVVVSFLDYNTTQIIPAFLLQNYEELLLSPVTWQTYLHTLKFAVITWALTLVIGFTVAYFLAFHVRSATWQMVLFLVCTIPFLTSNIIRMISWIPFLGRNGLVNSTLIQLGLIQRAARVPAVLQLRGRAGLRAPLHAVHGDADLQLDDAHRPQPARGGARRRRLGLADAVERHHAAVQARHRHRLDLRRHHRDGRLRHRAADERRPERLGRR